MTFAEKDLGEIVSATLLGQTNCPCPDVLCEGCAAGAPAARSGPTGVDLLDLGEPSRIEGLATSADADAAPSAPAVADAAPSEPAVADAPEAVAPLEDEVVEIPRPKPSKPPTTRAKRKRPAKAGRKLRKKTAAAKPTAKKGPQAPTRAVRQEDLEYLLRRIDEGVDPLFERLTSRKAGGPRAKGARRAPARPAPDVDSPRPNVPSLRL